MALHMPPEKLFQHIVSDHLLVHVNKVRCVRLGGILLEPIRPLTRCHADLQGPIFQLLLHLFSFFELILKA